MSNQYSEQDKMGKAQAGQDKPQQLDGEYFGLARGLVSRDRRRNRFARLVVEPPRVAHSYIVLRETGGIIKEVQEGLRSFIGKPPHSLPPRIWYRLESLGDSYAKRQTRDPFAVFEQRTRGRWLLVAPLSERDSLEQVLVVSRRGRVVLEMASQAGDSGWLLRGEWGRYAREACFVFVFSNGESWNLTCRDALYRKLH